jgi:hypothetical protein
MQNNFVSQSVNHSNLLQVRCDCNPLRELAALVDFEHIVPRDHVLDRGAVLFRKEFYDSGLCVDDATGNEMSLKLFVRQRIVVAEPGERGDDDDQDTGIWLDRIQCVKP